MKIAWIPAIVCAALLLPFSGSAQEGKVTLTSRAPFGKVAQALQKAVADQKMGLVCHANAQQGAAARGVRIAGNQVFMVFRNDFAVRLLRAMPAAGFEAPIRIYLYENPDGTATLSYARPSALLGEYSHPEVDKVAAELDAIFEKIVAHALAVQ